MIKIQVKGRERRNGWLIEKRLHGKKNSHAWLMGREF